jgi:hypothetical protein
MSDTTPHTWSTLNGHVHGHLSVRAFESRRRLSDVFARGHEEMFNDRALTAFTSIRARDSSRRIEHALRLGNCDPPPARLCQKNGRGQVKARLDMRFVSRPGVVDQAGEVARSLAIRSNTTGTAHFGVVIRPEYSLVEARCFRSAVT